MDDIFVKIPSLPRKCPWPPGKYYGNFTEGFARLNYTGSDHYKIQFDSLPNGLYRITVKLSTKADPQGLFFQIFNQIKHRLNDENF
jgi:hypothetical protein